MRMPNIYIICRCEIFPKYQRTLKPDVSHILWYNNMQTVSESAVRELRLCQRNATDGYCKWKNILAMHRHSAQVVGAGQLCFPELFSLCCGSRSAVYS